MGVCGLWLGKQDAKGSVRGDSKGDAIWCEPVLREKFGFSCLFASAERRREWGARVEREEATNIIFFLLPRSQNVAHSVWRKSKHKN